MNSAPPYVTNHDRVKLKLIKKKKGKILFHAVFNNPETITNTNQCF